MIVMWSSVGLFVLSVALISLTHYWYRWNNPKCNGKILPPGSMGFPLIGETIQFFIPSKSLDMPPFVKKRVARYGALFRTSLVGQKVIMSTDAEFNYYILQQEGKFVQLWYMDSFSNFLGDVHDQTTIPNIHKYVKSLVYKHLGTETLKDKLLSRIEVIINQHLQSWSKQSSVEMRESIACMVFELTCEQFYSYDTTKSSKEMSKVFSSISEGLMSIPLNIPGTAFRRCLKNQEKGWTYMRNILHERLNSPENRCGDLLDQLIDDMNNEEFLTEKFVVSMMFGLVFASFDSIASTLTVGMTLVTDHPLVVKELKEEQETLLRSRKNVNSQLTWKEYKSLTFTPQVVKEVLRMSSTAPALLRKVIKDIHINGYVIPDGWTLMVVPSAVQMNPDKFKDPMAFNPWRWKDVGSNISVKNFIPFGGGSRNCAGAEFATAFMSVFLHVLVTKFSWTKIRGGNLSRKLLLQFGDGFHVKISEKM